MSIKVTIKDAADTTLKTYENGLPLSRGNLRAVLYEACVNTWVACNGLDLDTVGSVTIEILTPIHHAKVVPLNGRH